MKKSKSNQKIELSINYNYCSPKNISFSDNNENDFSKTISRNMFPKKIGINTVKNTLNFSKKINDRQQPNFCKTNFEIKRKTKNKISLCKKSNNSLYKRIFNRNNNFYLLTISNKAFNKPNNFTNKTSQNMTKFHNTLSSIKDFFKEDNKYNINKTLIENTKNKNNTRKGKINAINYKKNNNYILDNNRNKIYKHEEQDFSKRHIYNQMMEIIEKMKYMFDDKYNNLSNKSEIINNSGKSTIKRNDSLKFKIKKNIFISKNLRAVIQKYKPITLIKNKNKNEWHKNHDIKSSFLKLRSNILGDEKGDNSRLSNKKKISNTEGKIKKEKLKNYSLINFNKLDDLKKNMAISKMPSKPKLFNEFDSPENYLHQFESKKYFLNKYINLYFK